MKNGIPFILLLFLTALNSACGPSRSASEPTAGSVDEAIKVKANWSYGIRDLYYDMPIHVRFYPKDDELDKAVWTYLESVDDVFNDYKEGTEVHNLNRSHTVGTVTVSPQLAEAFEKSKKAWELSEGVFDITCAPIRNLWKTAAKKGVEPSKEEIECSVMKCGMDKLTVNDLQVTLSQAGLEFDFGGIIKGIVVDHVVAMLKEGGAQSALVQVGGETSTFGLSHKKRPFRIGIINPLDKFDSWSIIQDPGQGMSASTSGNYEQPIIINGKKYYHIMDPRTGYPARTEYLSVSIAFPETGKNWLTDTLSTTGVLLGPEKTFEIVDQLGGAAMFLMEKDGKLTEIASPGWKKFD